MLLLIFSHFLYIQILSRATVFLPPLPVILPLATFPSYSYYLFSLTLSYSFFSLLSLLPPLFLLYFSGHNSLSSYIIMLYQTLTAFPAWFPQHNLLEMLIPFNTIKMLFISITTTYCLQYLKIRTFLSNFSLFYICCSITHNNTMLLSPSLVYHMYWNSSISYLLRTWPECLCQNFPSEMTAI